jgi:uncharacterized protein
LLALRHGSLRWAQGGDILDASRQRHVLCAGTCVAPEKRARTRAAAIVYDRKTRDRSRHEARRAKVGGMAPSGPDGISREEARDAMRFTGTITVEVPREALFARLRDASFFASCVEGVREVQKIDCHHYTAVLETSIAYLKFRFDVAVTLVRADEPREIEARIEGTPAGIVGRLTATSVTRLAEEGTGTRLAYEVEAVLTGKLGSIGQSVLRIKAKAMERTFAERMRMAFATGAAP